MYVTLHNVVSYLLERGFVSARQVVHDRCRVDNASSRNRCFAVSFAGSPGVFVKQARPGDPTTLACLEIESACGRAFHDGGATAGLAEYVPRALGYDATRGVLCSELVPAAESARVYQLRRGDRRPDVAAALGVVLGKIHGPAAARIVERLPQTARHRVPGVLHAGFLDAGPAQDRAGVYAQVRAYPEYATLLRESAAHWEPDGLTHGDVRWDNFLVAEAEAGLGVRVIDWELAGYGDTAWDVAGVVQGYLIDWVSALVSTDELRALVGRFWSEYLGRRGRPAPDAAGFLRRVVRYAGCRLVQSTFEQHQYGTPLGEQGRNQLQLSWNLLRDPAAAEADLLGLSAPGGGRPE